MLALPTMIAFMASLTIRNIEPQLKARLRVRAARNDRSMEEEARVILREAVDLGSSPPKNL
ncbi:MAG: FitA-like ribbon-helix-helix domain-containing protein, partial [bacterium]